MYDPEIAHKIASVLYEELQVFRFLKFSILAELGSILGPKIDFLSFKKNSGRSDRCMVLKSLMLRL